MVSQSAIHSTGHPLSPPPPDQQWRPAGNATVDTREVGPDTRECTFNVLTPGRGYTITVATISGNLSSSIAVEGRTGESRTWQPPYLHQHLLTLYLPLCVCMSVPMALSNLTLRNSGVSSLQASWVKPEGDVDFYKLTLLQNR